MSRIDDALRDSGLTWRPAEDGDWALHEGSDVVGRLRGEIVTLDGHRYELRHGRGYTALVDSGLGSSLGSLRIAGHGAGLVTLASTRARISRRGVAPFRWEVTADLGGPRLLELLHLGSRLRIKAGPALDDHDDVDAGVLAVFAALVILPTLRTRTIKASPAA